MSRSELGLAVTALVPAHNAALFLADALRSILGQTRPPDEVLVVDDGSDDGTDDVARGFPGVRIVRRTRGGPSAARNTGIAAATGTLVAMCDADDVWESEKLDRQLAMLDAHPEVDVVFTDVEEFVDARVDLGSMSVRRPFTRASGPLPSSMLIRRGALDAAGPFDESLPAGDWIEWYLRLVDSGVVRAHIGEVLVRRRIHGRNNSLQTSDERTEHLRAVREHIARMRRQP